MHKKCRHLNPPYLSIMVCSLPVQLGTFLLLSPFCICLFTVKEVRKIVCAKSSSVGRAIESMIRTGKLNTLSSLDLPQVYFYHYSF